MTDIESLILGYYLKTELKETQKFLNQRLRVMFENMISMTESINQFDNLSKVFLDLLHQVLAGREDSLLLLSESKEQLLGKLLVKAMLDNNEL